MVGSGIIKIIQETAKRKGPIFEIATVVSVLPITISPDNTSLVIPESFIINTITDLNVSDRVVISTLGSRYVILGKVV